MMRSLVATALVASLSLTGCAALEKQEKDERADAKALTAVAKGNKVKGTGYTFTAPKGWGPPPTKIAGLERADKAVFDLRDRKDGFTDNVNVLIAPPGAYPVDKIESAALNEIGQFGAKLRRVHDQVLVSGEATSHVSAEMTKNTFTYLVEQYYPHIDDQVYVVTFSFSPDVERPQRERIAESVLNTWKWTD